MSHTSNHMTSRHATSHHTSHHVTTHDMTSRNQPHYFASQPTALLNLASPPTTWHRATSHHSTSPPPTHHGNATGHCQNNTTKTIWQGMAEGWRTQKTRFGQRTGWWPCAHYIGKFFPWLVWFFRPETFAPTSPSNYWYIKSKVDVTRHESRMYSDVWTRIFDAYNMVLIFGHTLKLFSTAWGPALWTWVGPKT